MKEKRLPKELSVIERELNNSKLTDYNKQGLILQRAHYYASIDDTKSAKSDFEYLYTKNKNNIRAHISYGFFLLKTKEVEQALKVFSKLDKDFEKISADLKQPKEKHLKDKQSIAKGLEQAMFLEAYALRDKEDMKGATQTFIQLHSRFKRRPIDFQGWGRFMQRNHLKEAISIFSKGVEAYPNDHHLWVAYLRCLTQDKQHKHALSIYLNDKIPQTVKDEPDMLLGLAYCYIENSRMSDALAVLEKATLKYPQDKKILLTYLVHLERHGRIPKAKTLYQEAADQDWIKDDLTFRRNHARFLESIGAFSEATESFAKLSKDFPKDKTTDICYLRCLGKTGETTKVTGLFEERLVKHGDEDAQLFLEYGRCLKNLGEIKRAQEVFLRGRTAHPTDVALALGLLYTYDFTAQQDKAKEIADSLSSTDIKESQPFRDLINFYLHSDVSKALELLEKNIKKMPKDSYLLRQYIFCLRKQGEDQKLLTFLKKLQEESPYDMDIASIYAEELYEIGDAPNAIALYEKVIAEKTATSGFIIQYVHFLIKIGHYPPALKIIFKAYQENKDCPEITRCYCLALQKNNKHTVAGQLLAQLYEDFSSHALVAEDYAQFLVKYPAEQKEKNPEVIIASIYKQFPYNVEIILSYVSISIYFKKVSQAKDILLKNKNRLLNQNSQIACKTAKFLEQLQSLDQETEQMIREKFPEIDMGFRHYSTFDEKISLEVLQTPVSALQFNAYLADKSNIQAQIKFMKQAYEKFNQDVDIALDYYYLFKKAGLHRESNQLGKELKEKFPHTLRVQLMFNKILIHSDLKKAEENFIWLEKNFHSPLIKMNKAIFFEKQGKFVSAEKILIKLLEQLLLNQKISEIYVRLLLKTENYKAAIIHLEQILPPVIAELEVKAKESRVILTLYELYIDTLLKDQRYRQAYDLCIKLTKKYPNHLPIKRFYAICLHRSGNYPAAIAELQKLREAFPQDIDVALTYGKILEENMMVETAFQLYKEMLAVFPTHFLLKTKSVEALLENHKPKLALEELTILKKDYPIHPSIVVLSAKALFMDWHYEEAIAELEEYLKDNFCFEADLLLAKYYFKSGSYCQANIHYNKLLKKYPHNVWVLKGYIRFLMDAPLKSLPSASGEIKNSIDEFPHFIPFRLYRLELLLRENKSTKKFIEECQHSYPENKKLFTAMKDIFEAFYIMPPLSITTLITQEELPFIPVTVEDSETLPTQEEKVIPSSAIATSLIPSTIIQKMEDKTDDESDIKHLTNEVPQMVKDLAYLFRKHPYSFVGSSSELFIRKNTYQHLRKKHLPLEKNITFPKPIIPCDFDIVLGLSGGLRKLEDILIRPELPVPTDFQISPSGTKEKDVYIITSLQSPTIKIDVLLVPPDKNLGDVERDFTISAIHTRFEFAWEQQYRKSTECKNAEVSGIIVSIDKHNGIKDIKQNIIRLIDPIEGFKKDPIRILRAISKKVRSGYKFDPSLEKLLPEDAKLLADYKDTGYLASHIEKLFSFGAVTEVMQLCVKYHIWDALFLTKNELVADDILPFLQQHRQRVCEQYDEFFSQNKSSSIATLFCHFIYISAAALIIKRHPPESIKYSQLTLFFSYFYIDAMSRLPLSYKLTQNIIHIKQILESSELFLSLFADVAKILMVKVPQGVKLISTPPKILLLEQGDLAYAQKNFDKAKALYHSAYQACIEKLTQDNLSDVDWENFALVKERIQDFKLDQKLYEIELIELKNRTTLTDIHHLNYLLDSKQTYKAKFLAQKFLCHYFHDNQGESDVQQDLEIWNRAAALTPMILQLCSQPDAKIEIGKKTEAYRKFSPQEKIVYETLNKKSQFKAAEDIASYMDVYAQCWLPGFSAKLIESSIFSDDAEIANTVSAILSNFHSDSKPDHRFARSLLKVNLMHHQHTLETKLKLADTVTLPNEVIFEDKTESKTKSDIEIDMDIDEMWKCLIRAVHELGIVNPNLPKLVKSFSEEAKNQGRNMLTYYALTADILREWDDVEAKSYYQKVQEFKLCFSSKKSRKLSSATDMLTYVHSMYCSGEVKQADVLCQQALAAYPYHLKLRLLAAEIGTEENPTLALAMCQDILKIQPDNFHAKKIFGNIYLKMKDYDQAGSIYRELLNKPSAGKDWEILLSLAEIYITQKQYVLALHTYLGLFTPTSVYFPNLKQEPPISIFNIKYICVFLETKFNLGKNKPLLLKEKTAIQKISICLEHLKKHCDDPEQKKIDKFLQSRQQGKLLAEKNVTPTAVPSAKNNMVINNEDITETGTASYLRNFTPLRVV